MSSVENNNVLVPYQGHNTLSSSLIQTPISACHNAMNALATVFRGTPSDEPIDISACELSITNQRMIKAIVEKRIAAMKGSCSTNEGTKVLSKLRSILPGAEDFGERIGENAAIQFSPVLTNAALTAYIVLFGPTSPIIAIVSKEALRFLYSKQMLENVWRPAGVKAGSITAKVTKEISSAAYHKVRDTLKNKQLETVDVEKHVKRNSHGQILNANSEPLTERDMQAINQLLVTIDLALRLITAPRGEIKKTLLATLQTREDGKKIWIDGSFVRTKFTDEDREEDGLQEQLESFGIISENHNATINAAAKILESTNPDVSRTRKTVEQAFDLIAFFTARKVHSPLLDNAHIIKCEDGKYMHWNDGNILTAQQVEAIAAETLMTEFPPEKELSDEDIIRKQQMDNELRNLQGPTIIFEEEIDNNSATTSDYKPTIVESE